MPGSSPAHFDSLLVKVTARGRDLPTAAVRADRALAEFRVRGVSTNIAFLRAMLAEGDFRAGRTSTAFVEEPHLTTARPGADRASKLLDLLADATVNRPHGAAPVAGDPRRKFPDATRLEQAPPPGSKQRLEELGPEGFAAWLRNADVVGITDTTLRDAHQSLLATRLRTFDMLGAAPFTARMLPHLLSLEVWGGATFDVALRFLHEDAWMRLSQVRDAVPNICLQMLLGGDNAVGYGRYPAAMVRAFVDEAARTGIDIFRIFDANNDVGRMTNAIRAAADAGAVAEGTLCYTDDLLDPGETLYTFDHYLRLAERLVGAGGHILCIKEMAGLLRAPGAHALVTALRERFGAPVHLHTHDAPGGQIATYAAAIAAGADAVDGAASALSGMTSQPSLAAIVAALDHAPRATRHGLVTGCARRARGVLGCGA